MCYVFVRLHINLYNMQGTYIKSPQLWPKLSKKLRLTLSLFVFCVVETRWCGLKTRVTSSTVKP